MRWNQIAVSVVVMAMLAAAATAIAKEKKAGPAKGAKEHAKALTGTVSAVTVSGDSVSWTLQTAEGEKTVSMPASVNAMVKTDGGEIIGIHANKGKSPQVKGDKVKVVTGTVTAASVADGKVSVTIHSGDADVQGTMRDKVSVMLDKDGNAMMIKAAAAASHGGKTEKGNKPEKGKKGGKGNKGGDDNGTGGDNGNH